MSFSTLGLDSSLLDNLTRLGYAEPTPVQREAIPAVLAGGDLLVSSQTGSGKTAAFVLPGLQRLRTAATLPGKGPRMLVLTPTRELAMQVQKATHGYCSGQKLRTALLVGGMPFRMQLAQIEKPVDIAIATPGRLKDHMDRGSVDLGRVELLVLDEADRMLDSLLRETDVEQALVFTAMKRTAAELTLSLVEKGFTAGALHGDMQQKDRTRMLNQLRDGRMRVLVATDVAARGIDVPGINLVVNYDAPRMAEDYVHRIGRTGRAGRAGIAVTFLGHADRNLVRQIERFTGNKVSLMEIKGLEPRVRQRNFQSTKRGI